MRSSTKGKQVHNRFDGSHSGRFGGNTIHRRTVVSFPKELYDFLTEQSSALKITNAEIIRGLLESERQIVNEARAFNIEVKNRFNDVVRMNNSSIYGGKSEARLSLGLPKDLDDFLTEQSSKLGVAKTEIIRSLLMRERIKN